MAIIRFTDQPFFTNPWAEFERLRQGLDQLSRNLLSTTETGGRATVFPPLNIYENDENLIIKAELPGMQAEDLDISVEGDTLTIQGKRQRQEEEKASYHRREIASGSFSRAITLPTKVDMDKIQASLNEGILTVTLAKAAEAKPRKIAVQTEANRREQ